MGQNSLIVFAHPALERARVNAMMAEAAAAAPGVTFRDLYELYPDFAIDVRAEQELLAASNPVVLQFPLFWFSGPALLKEWFDLVWVKGFAHGETGQALRGKTLMCAVFAAGQEADYGPGGVHRFSLDEFLRPFEQIAHQCGMRWAKPFVVHIAKLPVDDEQVARITARYREHLAAVAAKCAKVGLEASD